MFSFFILFSFISFAQASQVTVGWDPNIESDLAGYIVYCGTSSRNYDYSADVGKTTEHTIPDLVEGQTYYFAATAYDTAGNVSGYSSELIHTIPATVNDSDGDGLSDADEGNVYGTDPNTADTDGDGISDGDEVNVYQTNPTAADSDGDGVDDGTEIDNGSDPLAGDNSNNDPSDNSNLAITNLSVASGAAYEVVDTGVQVDDTVYIDRDYTFSTLPAHLVNNAFIRTANSDKKSDNPDFLAFDTNQGVTVFVAHDHRIDVKPNWLHDFVDTGDQVVTSDTTFEVFSKYFPAGSIVLGGNQGSGYSMYSVFIRGENSSDGSGGSGSEGDIDADGDGFSENQGDCNDAAAGIYPGADEICGDGLDQDCNGADQECQNDGPIDTDGDGLSDADEGNVYGTDPYSADTDGDGINDGDEVDVYRTDPTAADSDGDGVDDGTEIDNGSDPLAADGGSDSDDSPVPVTTILEPMENRYESTTRQTRVTFDVKGIGDPISSARLRFYFTQPVDVLRLYYDGSEIGTWSEIASMEWSELDVADIVTGNGTYSFILKTYTSYGYFSYQSSTSRDNNTELEITAMTYGSGQAPVASFLASPTSGPAPLTVEFDASDSYDPDGQVVAYRWNFGDGATVDGGLSTQHVFTEVGIYNVKLTITDDSGFQDTFITTITVNESDPLESSLVFSPSNTVSVFSPDSYLSFNVSGIGGQVTGAKVRMKLSGAADTVLLSYNGNEIGRLSNPEPEVWHELDVSHIVDQNGQYVFDLQIDYADLFTYYFSGGTNQYELVVYFR